MRRWAVGAAAVTMVAAGGAAVALRHDEPKPVPNVLYPLHDRPAPPGTRWLLYRGIEVAVPAAWLDAQVDACGNWQTDIVLVNDRRGDDCASIPDLHANVVVVATGPLRDTDAHQSPKPDPAFRVRTVTVDGEPARRSSGAAWYGMHVETLAFTDRHAAVNVLTEDPAVAERILATVRVTNGVDARGCPIHPASVYALGPPARDGARDTMVPGTPVQASVCRYLDDWVVVSKVASAKGAATLAASLNALPPGLGPADRGRERASFLVVFRYATGPDLLVRVRPWSTDRTGVTNGAVDAGIGGDVPDVVKPYTGWFWTYEQRRVG